MALTWDDIQGAYVNDDGSQNDGGYDPSAPQQQPYAPVTAYAGDTSSSGSGQSNFSPYGGTTSSPYSVGGTGGMPSVQAVAPQTQIDPMAFAAPVGGAPGQAPGATSDTASYTGYAAPAPTPAPATNASSATGADTMPWWYQPPAPASSGWDDIQGAYVNPDGSQSTGSDPNASAATKAWDSYSPLANLTDAAKTEYWAGQGTQGLAGVGDTPARVTGPGSVVDDPSKNADATAAYLAANAPAISAVTSQVQGGQAAAQQAVNTANAATNSQYAADDKAKDLATFLGAGGVLDPTTSTNSAIPIAQDPGAIAGGLPGMAPNDTLDNNTTPPPPPTPTVRALSPSDPSLTPTGGGGATVSAGTAGTTVPAGGLPEAAPNNTPDNNATPSGASPTMTTQQWDDYSPLAGLTEAQKTAYWAGQGTQGLSGVGYTPGPEGYDPAKAQAATDAYRTANAPEIDALTKLVQGNQASALSQYNAGNAGLNAQFTAEDQAKDRQTFLDAGGILPGNEEYAATHGGYNDPSRNPNAGSLTQTPTGFVNPVSGAPASQGGTVTNGVQSGAPTNADRANPPQPDPNFNGGGAGGGASAAFGGAPRATDGGYSANPGRQITGGGTGSTGNTGNASNTPAADASAGLAPHTDTVNPDSDLRSKQITPGDFLDRFKLAQQRFGTYADSTNPQYEKALRDATRSAAGAGRLGSGMLRTSYGDLANQRGNSLNQERDRLFQDALEGSVGDAQTNFQDLLAEQAYQTGAQNQDFNQNVTGQQLQDNLTNSAFQRALAQLNAGNAGNPSSALQFLSQLFQGQSGDASKALAALIGNTTRNSGSSDQTAYLDELKKLLAQYGGYGGAPTSSNNSNDPYADDGQ